jgi:DnaA N-terminal domain
MVRVDVAAVRERLAVAGTGDRDAWEQIRGLLLEGVGESTFELWLARLELVAVDRDESLVIDAPGATRGWVVTRFSRLLERCAAQAGRVLRFASEHERRALAQRPGDVPVALSREQDPADPVAGDPALRNRCVASISRAGRASADSSTDRSTSAPNPSGDWRSDQPCGGLSYRSGDDSSYMQVNAGRTWCLDDLGPRPPGL